MRKLTVLIIILCILIINVNGARYINYNLYEGRISFNGTLIRTNIPVDNVNVVGYSCLDERCKTLGEHIFNPGVLNSRNNTFIQLVFPTELMSKFGYGVYYYKDGYIAWEQNPNWFGTDSRDSQGSFNIYLTKKEVCNSFVTNLSVDNEAKPYLPLAIQVTSGISAETNSGISNAGPLEAIPSEAISSYQARQQVRLRIFDENNNLIYEKINNTILNFGGNKSFNFEYVPNKTGRHKIIVSSKVTDSKCLNSPEIMSSKEITIFNNEKPLNMCYTILNNIRLSSYNIKSGDTIIISGKKISNLFS